MAYNLLFVSENERDQIKRDLTLRKLFFKWFAQAKKSTHRETETQYANSHTIVAHFRLFESRFSVAVVRLLVFFCCPPSDWSFDFGFSCAMSQSATWLNVNMRSQFGFLITFAFYLEKLPWSKLIWSIFLRIFELSRFVFHSPIKSATHLVRSADERFLFSAADMLQLILVGTFGLHFSSMQLESRLLLCAF